MLFHGLLQVLIWWMGTAAQNQRQVSLGFNLLSKLFFKATNHPTDLCLLGQGHDSELVDSSLLNEPISFTLYTIEKKKSSNFLNSGLAQSNQWRNPDHCRFPDIICDDFHKFLTKTCLAKELFDNFQTSRHSHPRLL